MDRLIKKEKFMDKPFTLKVNDLQQNIIKLLNEAQMPYYVLKNILVEIVKEIEKEDGEEITKYLNENLKEKEDSNGNM